MTTTFLEPERDRATIPDKYTWNLEDLFPSLDAWRLEKDRVAAALPTLGGFRGRLAASPATLADALDALMVLKKDLLRLYAYASMLADQDTRNATHQGMTQEMTQLAAALGAESAFVEPEILGFDRATIDGFLAEEPRLLPYHHLLDDVLRRAAHTLTPGEEKLLADVGPLADAPSTIHNILSNADFPYPVVTLSDGQSVRVDQARYAELRALPNRQDRQAVMSAFLSTLGGYRRTFGTTMNGHVQKVLFFARARKYGSALEFALDAPNVPTSVYIRLIEGVNRYQPSFHRYLRLRARMLRVEDLHYYDLYAPLVPAVEARYTPEEAEALIVQAVAPLGDDYQATIARAFSERWIDMYPSEGKKSGAYSEGIAYDVHPFILMNYNARFDDVSTLAHELGHTMQSHLSNQAQPFATADYPTFVAEVASTFNEALLVDRMLRTTSDDAVKLSLLGNYLESIKSTVFRQTQFAEFELRMHEMAANGAPITGDALAELYLQITRRYYGHASGVCVVDDFVQHEWSYIPHFYREFYVFQYATSFTASEALAARVKSGDADATRRYLAFLAAGGSQYPIDLLREAGVDMNTDEPLDLTMREMERAMDQMDEILAARDGGGVERAAG
ncbi:MAG: oligoendopeptidase F [Vicinamibacterales bacterium]